MHWQTLLLSCPSSRSLFLQTNKVHIDYEDIPKMQKTAEGRVKLAIYCVKDSWLPCELIVKLSKMINAISMSQVTHVSVQDVLSRGQQIRTLTLMLVFILKRTENNRLHKEVKAASGLPRQI